MRDGRESQKTPPVRGRGGLPGGLGRSAGMRILPWGVVLAEGGGRPAPVSGWRHISWSAGNKRGDSARFKSSAWTHHQEIHALPRCSKQSERPRDATTVLET